MAAIERSKQSMYIIHIHFLMREDHTEITMHLTIHTRCLISTDECISMSYMYVHMIGFSTILQQNRWLKALRNLYMTSFAIFIFVLKRINSVSSYCGTTGMALKHNQNNQGKMGITGGNICDKELNFLGGNQSSMYCLITSMLIFVFLPLPSPHFVATTSLRQLPHPCQTKW